MTAAQPPREPSNKNIAPNLKQQQIEQRDTVATRWRRLRSRTSRISGILALHRGSTGKIYEIINCFSWNEDLPQDFVSVARHFLISSLCSPFSDYIICPYGHLSYIIPILSIFGTIFFCSAAFGCSLAIARSAYHEIYIGYWFRESTGFAISNGEEGDGNICVSWEDTSNLFDGLWRFGKAIGVLGVMTCFMPMLFDLILLYRRLDHQWREPLLIQASIEKD